MKKALFLLVTVVISGLGPKVFAKDAYSAFFAKHYTKTADLANDIEQGKTYLVYNVTELQFINSQLDNWNTQLLVHKVLNTNGKIFQLQKNFTSIVDAKKYFLNILRNHSLDNQLIWSEGDYLLARVNKTTGQFSDDWLRSNNPGEVVVELVPNSFDEVSSSDGEYATIPGFSLYCGNRMTPKKIVEPKTEPERIVYKEREKEVLVPNPNNSDWGDPPKTTTTTTSTTSSGGNVTNNYINTSTTNIENPSAPAPVIVKNNQNGQMLLMAGMMVVGQVMGTMLNIWSMKQQYKMMPQQAINYSPVYYLPQSIPVNNPGFTPIQGFATGNDWAANPIQGNTGGNTWANPIQGGINYTPNYTPTVNVYDPIQGNTQFTSATNLVYDPVQGWVIR